MHKVQTIHPGRSLLLLRVLGAAPGAARADADVAAASAQRPQPPRPTQGHHAQGGVGPQHRRRLLPRQLPAADGVLEEARQGVRPRMQVVEIGKTGDEASRS